MIQTICDNCGKTMRDKPDASGAEPEPFCTLKLRVAKADKVIHPIDMDLCLKCAKKYLRILSDPV